MISSQMIEAHIHKREFKDAESLIQRWLKQEPKNNEALYLQGVSDYLQGKVGPAIDALKKVLAVDPRHTDAAICLSVLFNDLGKYEEAKKVFELANQSVAQKREGVASAVDQKFAIKHLELADLYFRYRRYDEAIDEYTRAIVLDPRSYEARIRRAKAHARRGFVSRALGELQKIKSEDPNYLPARIQLGLLYYSQKNLVDAELEWEEVVSLDPNHGEATAYLEMCRKARLHQY